MKVLHLITSITMGGAQDNTLLTLEKHNSSYCEVHLASNPNGFWQERAQKAADVFHPLPNLLDFGQKRVVRRKYTRTKND